MASTTRQALCPVSHLNVNVYLISQFVSQHEGPLWVPPLEPGH